MQALPDILSLRPDDLAIALKGPGRARAVYALLREGRDPFAEGALGPKARARLASVCRPNALELRAVRASSDGTRKVLLGLEDGLAVEAVLIPDVRRTTLCVSSQVGCARGCTFCLTATMKLVRSLSAAEITAQIVAAIQLAARERLPPLRNLVFMGMGEPLDNLEEVERALALITASGNGLGFGPGHVTVSTVGPSPRAIAGAESLPARIAWSLHAADDDLRRSLVPTQRHTVLELRDAFRALVGPRREALFVEMTLIDSYNDGAGEARAAADLFRNFDAEVRFNLLPMNPIPGSPALHPSRPERLAVFARILREAGHFTMVRRARGADELAACGQLAVLQSAS